MSEFLNFGIPWWAWALPSGGALIAAFFALSRFVGFKNALYIVGMLAVPGFILLVHTRGKQAGWQARIDKENKDADDLLARARRARDSRNAGGLRDDDGFKRPE